MKRMRILILSVAVAVAVISLTIVSGRLRADARAKAEGRRIIANGVAHGMRFYWRTCPKCGDVTGILTAAKPGGKESSLCRKCGARITEK